MEQILFIRCEFMAHKTGRLLTSCHMGLTNANFFTVLLCTYYYDSSWFL